jgi:transaldolase
MIKVPGTREGYRLIRTLTARGIATNNTLSFMIPQFLACARAVREGWEQAQQARVDLSHCRSVITFMSARFTSLGTLAEEAGHRGVDLSEADLRWAELAIMKKACRLLQEGDYRSKMLMCSMRLGPSIGGRQHCWHLEKLAGANIVYTCPPKFIAALLLEGHQIELRNQYTAPVPDEVIERLLQLEYFGRAYDEEGYTPAEFNSHPALLATAQQFNQAVGEMIEFVSG